ncbi:MAG: helix-turn-helix transcriptional regulator [Bacilli bacterium]|nr:helix-turn-helix transcriptional regulator [Bacilli bacterium]
MEKRKIVYPVLKATMKEHKDTIETLSKLLNISEMSVWRRLSGNYEWKASEAMTICQHYGVVFEELFKKD